MEIPLVPRALPACPRFLYAAISHVPLEGDRCWILIFSLVPVFSFVLLILGSKYLYILWLSVINLLNGERKESYFSCCRKTSPFNRAKWRFRLMTTLLAYTCIHYIYVTGMYFVALPAKAWDDRYINFDEIKHGERQVNHRSETNLHAHCSFFLCLSSTFCSLQLKFTYSSTQKISSSVF